MKRRGYTLLELVMVLAVLALVMSVVLIRYTAIQQRELDVFLKDLRFARSYAVSDQQSVRVQFNLDDDSYAIYDSKGSLLLSKEFQNVDLQKLYHIDSNMIIKPSGAFSKCGHIELMFQGKPYKLNFTVGVARFTLRTP